MITLIRFVIAITALVSIAGCSKGGAGASATPQSSNGFTATGTDLTIDKITSSNSGSSLGQLSVSQSYYGRVLYVSGSTLYSASIHFTLNKDSDSTAYFSNFYLDRLAQVSSISGATPVVTSSTNLNVTPSYSSSTNGLTINNATSRFVKFNVDFGDNTHFGDVTNAGVIFSSDFSTMVGGNNSSFFFIAQKASSMASVTNSDLLHTWSLANFTVNGSGIISVTSTSTVGSAGTGGHGYMAFQGQISGGGSYEGEATLNDSGTGVFVFGFDTTVGNGTPTADGVVDGAFLLSPDKQFILGYNVFDGVYFAGSL